MIDDSNRFTIAMLLILAIFAVYAEPVANRTEPQGAVMSQLEAALDGMKIKTAEKERIEEAVKTDRQSIVKDLRARALKRTQAVRDRANGPVGTNVGAALGGALAEVVRRKLVGRVTDNVLAQALGVGAIGVAAQYVESAVGIPGLRNIGLGHVGAAGFIAAAKGFEKEGSPDPVVEAYKGTTHKHIKDMKKKKKEDEDEDEE